MYELFSETWEVGSVQMVSADIRNTSAWHSETGRYPQQRPWVLLTPASPLLTFGSFLLLVKVKFIFRMLIQKYFQLLWYRIYDFHWHLSFVFWLITNWLQPTRSTNASRHGKGHRSIFIPIQQLILLKLALTTIIT